MADDLIRPFIGYRSAGRRPESQQDRRAAADAPLSALRGMVSGVLGAPGDIESLIRMLPGLSEQTVLPTSEDVEKRLPMRELNQTPTGKAFTTAGQLGGGFYTGPGSPLRAIAALPSAVSRAGRDFAMASSQSVSPMVVYHGSPHNFSRFDSSKIGTGEGNQSYGHGLYLAESPEVAKSYQTALTHSDDYVDGELLDSYIPKHFLARILSDESGNAEAARQSLATLARPGGSKSVADSAKQALKLLDAGERPMLKTIKPEGSIYKVDLPDDLIAKMLDWDKPLGEQNEVVKAAIEKTKLNLPSNAIDDLGGDLSLMYGPDVTPGEFLNTWESLGKNAGGELALREAGIPGIRYLDQQSRNAGQFSITPPSETVSGKWMVKGTDYNSSGMHFDTEAEAIAKLKEMNADATQNFVVFPGEEEALTILKRNNEDLQGYQAGGAVKAAKATAKSLGDLVRKYTAETQLNEANQVAEEIKKLGPQFLPKIEQTSGGSVYLTVSQSPLTKQGAPAKNRNLTPIDFKARFADHPSYWGSTISSDPVTGNTPETIVEMFKHKIGSGDLPAYSEAKFNPADKYGYVTDVRREEGVSHKGNPVMKTIKDERPFTFYEPDTRGKGYAEGGQVTGANFPTDDFDPDRIDAIVAELHAMNAV